MRQGVARVFIKGFDEQRIRELARLSGAAPVSDPDWWKKLAADFPGSVVKRSGNGPEPVH